VGRQVRLSKPFGPEEIISNAVGLGRAYVRMVETADALLDRKPFWTEKFLLRIVRALYSHRLREMITVLSPEMTAEILAASEKMTGPIIGFTNNWGAINRLTIRFAGIYFAGRSS
jgi:hypothetical protein